MAAQRGHQATCTELPMTRRFDHRCTVVAADETRRAPDRARRKIGSTGHEVEGAPMVRPARWGASAGTSAGVAMA